jgi:UPF0755 protein
MMLILLIIVFVSIVILGIVYKIQTSPVDSSDKTIVELDVPKGSAKQIGELLEENDLIRSAKFFSIYYRLFKPGELYAGKHSFSKSMNYEEIFEELNVKPTYNPDEITLSFKEGITMRKIAEVIANGTNNEESAVFDKLVDNEYLDKIIAKYWFVTDDIKNSELKYSLEGYLFPDTYNFKNKDVTVEEIFNTMLDEMEKVLEPYKEDIQKSDLSIHQLITLASVIEKEAVDCNSDSCTDKDEYRVNISRVFYNRLESNMNLGSDVTTYYALDIDNAKKYVEEDCGGRNCINYNVESPYNTRNGDGSMNGKLPVGPIATVSKGSIKAAIYPSDVNYKYFIANIQTNELFFYENINDFNAKKKELSSVNQGL